MNFLYIGYIIILIFLLCYKVNMQACSESNTNSSIDLIVYNNDLSSDSLVLLSLELDSSLNKYILYESNSATSLDVHMAKVHPNGTNAWAKSYSDLKVTKKGSITALSGGETKIRMVTERYPTTTKFIEISTGTLFK